MSSSASIRSYRTPSEKLRFLKSPVVESDSDTEEYDVDDPKGLLHRIPKVPQLARREEPTLLEIFFDLFFAANYNVFSDNQEVVNLARFQAYIGYFYLLWVTWFLVTLYDVRYVTDSIFARLTRAIQLGVLVGFTVVAPNFDPTEQHQQTMQAMSLILMISRASLAVEYSSTLWLIKKYDKARLPLYIQITIHSTAALIYFSVAFGFEEGVKSNIFIAWYLMSGVEAIATILFSNFYQILSLTDTHIIKRLCLLTIIIIGDGIIQIAREVVVIVKNPDAWDKLTIGLLTAATATIYFIFLIYFDWLRSSFYLPAIRQQLWVTLHLPFHLGLILFTQGFIQFLIWSKIVDVLDTINLGFGVDRADWLTNATSLQVRQRLDQSVELFFKDFTPKISSTFITVNNALNNITDIPDSFWPDLSNFYKSGNMSAFNDDADVKSAQIFSEVLQAVLSSMANALFATFGMNLEGEVTTKNPTLKQEVNDGGFQGEVQLETWDRYKLVFAYTYVAAGFTLFLMIILHVVARTSQLKVWPIARLTIIFFLALGTSLTALLFYSPEKAFTFLSTLWVLPTITFVWFVVLVITHINADNIGRRLPALHRL